MKRYWVSNSVLLNLSDRLGEALPSDKFTPMVKADDAQATIAALQARVQELEQWVSDQSNANLQTMRHLDDMQTRAMEAEAQLTQRTAELEAAKREVDVWKEKAELRGKEACAQRARVGAREGAAGVGGTGRGSSQDAVRSHTFCERYS